jgi:hypothetical protein
MASRLILLVGLLISFAAPVLADKSISVKSGTYQTAVLELYTSEGCSSCPPADEWFTQLITIPRQELDVLPLAMHVDYWDYIGWKDEFAQASFTQRQRDLGRLNHQRSIYTPEFFVNGIEARGASAIVKRIRDVNRTLSEVHLKLNVELQKMQYQLHLSSESNTHDQLKVQFFVFEDNLSNEVRRGENAGKTLSHQRVVRYISPRIDLQPSIEHTVEIPPHWRKSELGLGALVQNARGLYLQSLFLSPELMQAM